MNKLIAAIKRAPKRAASIAIVAAAVVVPASLFAWGPDRPTFTYEHPAPYVTFNSITNNPTHGDERNFVQIKEASASNATYGENATLQPGKEYDVYVYYHNNAASNLNDAAHNYKGIAQNASMRVQMPATVAAGEKARVTGFVGASNANPAQVWDEAYGTNAAQSAVALRYVPGSAKIHSNGAVNGQTMPDSLYTTGAPLGYDKLDGKLPGCNEFAGYVTFRFKVDQPNFTVEKQVSKTGANTYSETVTALPNEEVEYKIKYKNTGTVQQDNVVIKDALPAGMNYVAGSTHVSNSKTNNQWQAIADDGIVGRGINLGSYAPGGAVYAKFKAKVVDNSKLEKCGVNTLVNTATAETENGSKSDTATVVVSKKCEEQPKNIQVCRLSDKKIITISEKDFDSSKYSKNLDDCKEAPAPKKIEVCLLSEKKVITIYEKDFDSSKHSKDLNDCKTTPPAEQIEVCRLSDKKIVTILEKDFDSSRYSKDFNDCKETPTPQPENCEIPGKEHLPKNSPECVETPATPVVPETPAELPTTGAGDNIVSLLGAGSLVAAIGYYAASRRALLG